MSPHRPPAPIPVTVIGGFLGAGKTTLLNHVLSEDHGVRAGVLVNDFGAINVDARLVTGVEGETVRLANGCVCCTIRDDLTAACLGLLARPEPPEHVLIETSGISNPRPVMKTFLQPELATAFQLASSLIVVDAEQLPGLGGAMGHVARTQIEAADIVVLNKVDLVSPGGLADVRRRVHEMAPGSRILEASYGRVPPELVFGTHARPAGPTAGQASTDGSSLEEEHPFATWSWTSDRPLSLPKLRAALEALPDSVYRVKGIVHLEELPSHRMVLQMVGRRHHIGDTGRWGAETPRSEVVLVGARDGVDGAALACALEACVGCGDASQSPVLRLTRRLGLSEPAGPRPEARDQGNRIPLAFGRS